MIPVARSAISINGSVYSVTAGSTMPDCIKTETTYKFNQGQVSFVDKLVGKAPLIPLADIKSHKDLYYAIILAQACGVTDDQVSERLSGWTFQPNWIALKHAEYLYPLYMVNRVLACFQLYFKSHPAPFACLRAAAGLDCIRKDPAMVVSMLSFYQNYNFATCFEANNDEVQARIEALKNARHEARAVFLLDPFTIADYFYYAPTGPTDIWDCKDISVVKPPVAGDYLLAPKVTVLDRIREFTYGVLDKPLNPANTTPFPFANVMFAGGAITKLVARDYSAAAARASDADLFIFGANFEERARVFDEVLAWFTSDRPNHVYYAVRGSVATIYIKDIRRKFQVISIDSVTPYDVIAHFDITHIQWGWVNGGLVATPGACQAMVEKITRVSNDARLRAIRMIKALHCGYSVAKGPTALDITSIINDPASHQLQKYLRDLYAWYYPTSESVSDLDERAANQHIMCMIQRDSDATIVTLDPAYIRENITIGGNFEGGYESMSFTTFNIALIMNRGANHRVTLVTLRSAHGVWRLTSPIMKASRVIVGDEGMDIQVKPDNEEFRAFCETLDTTVYQLYRQEAVTQRIITDGVINFSIAKYRVDFQATSGKSLMRTQRGEALNIEEDLVAGDDIQIVFTMNIHMAHDTKRVELCPARVIKYQRWDAAAAAKTREDHERLAREIATLEPQEGELEYEDSDV